MPMTVTEPIFPKFTPARQPSVNYSHTEFHENAENGLVDYIKSKRDGRTRSLHKTFLALQRTPTKDSTRISIPKFSYHIFNRSLVDGVTKNAKYTDAPQLKTVYNHSHARL
jgi:hypothetical protein